MLDSLIVFITTHGADVSAAANHTPQTALAAVLCVALINFFN
ncbi:MULTISPECIES: YshB family small membrane protein [unclassified Serratia (in: enterobacteria)]|nr:MULTISPECIES: YshB family small membrane protein [unclassified Serratia (in: enterobacteria)]